MKFENLNDTAMMMASSDYKDRFKAEYWQLRIRLDKLKDMIAKYKANELTFQTDCSIELLEEQALAMQNYLELLEARADIERIKLDV